MSRIVLIAAVAENGVIGRGNGLPFRLPTDLKRFKAFTLGKPVIMGRKTFESIGKALPNRMNIVVTRDESFSAEGVRACGSLDEALMEAHRFAVGRGTMMIGIIGGAEIYAQTIGRADKLHITEVKLAPEGDAVFPAIDPEIWREVSREDVPAGPKDEADMAFVTYIRRPGM